MTFSKQMLAMLKLFKRKKSYCETILGATGVLKTFTEITGKQLNQRLFLIKLQAYSNFFKGASFSNFQLGPVKKIQ